MILLNSNIYSHVSNLLTFLILNTLKVYIYTCPVSVLSNNLYLYCLPFNFLIYIINYYLYLFWFIIGYYYLLWFILSLKRYLFIRKHGFF